MQPTRGLSAATTPRASTAEFAQSGLIAPKGRRRSTRRRPLRDSAQCESGAAALGVETPASLEVAVNELGVLAYRAVDSKCVGRAERHGLLRRVRLHGPERRASRGPRTSAECLPLPRLDCLRPLDRSSARVAARPEHPGVPGAGGRRALAELRDLGPDLRAIRLAADVRWRRESRCLTGAQCTAAFVAAQKQGGVGAPGSRRRRAEWTA